MHYVYYVLWIIYVLCAREVRYGELMLTVRICNRKCGTSHFVFSEAMMPAQALVHIVHTSERRYVRQI